VTPAAYWAVCPVCRVFVDQLALDPALAPSHLIPCPWCGKKSELGRWLTAGARDLCACGCPRAAHAAYVTPDGEPPAPGLRARVIAAPCVGCGCKRLDGSSAIRME